MIIAARWRLAAVAAPPAEPPVRPVLPHVGSAVEAAMTALGPADLPRFVDRLTLLNHALCANRTASLTAPP